MHRMHQIGLLSIFLCDAWIAGKSQLSFKLRDNEFYSIVNGFDKYV